jgi:hypothetical protein
MQKRLNRITIILQILCLLSFIAGIVSSEQPENARDNCPDPLQVSPAVKNQSYDSGDNVSLVDEDTQKSADALSGTCPKGFCCSCAGCPLYSDLDDDRFCDLGEEPDFESSE